MHTTEPSRQPHSRPEFRPLGETLVGSGAQIKVPRQFYPFLIIFFRLFSDSAIFPCPKTKSCLTKACYNQILDLETFGSKIFWLQKHSKLLTYTLSQFIRSFGVFRSIIKKKKNLYLEQLLLLNSSKQIPYSQNVPNENDYEWKRGKKKNAILTLNFLIFFDKLYSDFSIFSNIQTFVKRSGIFFLVLLDSRQDVDIKIKAFKSIENKGNVVILLSIFG